VNKILGFQIDFIPRNYRFGFNPILYGRVCLNIKNDKKYWYYVPGILDSVPFFKINKNRIFVKDTDTIDFDLFDKYCISYKIVACEKPDEDIFLRTGRQIIKFRAKETGINVYGI
jgi:hypothetical protein